MKVKGQMDDVVVSEDQLVAELWARDVRFLMGGSPHSSPLLTGKNLLISLAQNRNARVRLALIPLLLRRPELYKDVELADASLSSQAGQIVLRFYYTAAVFLQIKYQERLLDVLGNQARLPVLFSDKLGISVSRDPNLSLAELAKRHQVLSRQFINWHGTYEHAAERLVKHMEKFR